MRTTEMDGFMGSVLAADSVSDATAILHGPFACRMSMSLLSEKYIKREFKTREGDYFFHFSRIPCTSIDRDDYIYGASKKVSMILDILEQDETKFATIVQSPGASLIGDKLKDEVIAKGLDAKTVVMDSSFMSEKFSLGFDTTLTRMAEKIVVKNEKSPRTVNVIGLPYTCRGYYEFLMELKTILGSMGVTVIAAVGAGCSLDEFRRSSAAECNVCIHPEYCRQLASFYENTFDVPTVVCETGVPVGYGSMRAFITAVASKLGVDPSPAMKIIDDDEHMVRMAMESSMGISELMHYKTFSIEGESSMILPIMDFMIRFLKMVPKSICITEPDPVFDEKISAVLKRIGCEEALDEEFGADFTNVLFGAGSYVKLREEQNMCDVGIDISQPSKDRVDIAPKSIMGIQGLHRMLDDILNAR